MIVGGVVLGLLSAVLVNLGFFVEHRAANRTPALRASRPLRSLWQLLSNPLWVLGYLAGWLGWLAYIAALWFAPLSLVQGLSAGGIGVLAGLVRFGGRRRLSGGEWAAVTASMLALVLLLGSFSAHGAPADHRQPAAGVAGGLAVLAAIGTLIAVALAARRRPGPALAALAGTGYAIGDVATKAAVERDGWVFVLLLLAANLAGFLTQQLSFQRGGALGTAGVSTLLTNALPIGAAIVVFGEQIPSGAVGVARLASFLAVLVSAVYLAGSPAARRPAPRPE